MNVSRSNRAQGLRCTAGSSRQETLMHRAQVETSVETITEGGQVVSRILSKVECMVATRKAGLEITENGVDPLELGGHPWACVRPSPSDDGCSPLR